MSIKNKLCAVGLALGVSLFVCAGTLGTMAFVALYYYLMGLGE